MNVRDFVRGAFPGGCVVVATGALTPQSTYEDGEVAAWSLSHVEEVEEWDGVAAVDDSEFFQDLWDCEALDMNTVQNAATFPCEAMMAYQDGEGRAWVACLDRAENKHGIVCEDPD